MCECINLYIHSVETNNRTEKQSTWTEYLKASYLSFNKYDAKEIVIAGTATTTVVVVAVIVVAIFTWLVYITFILLMFVFVHYTYDDDNSIRHTHTHSEKCIN